MNGQKDKTKTHTKRHLSILNKYVRPIIWRQLMYVLFIQDKTTNRKVKEMLQKTICLQ